jgi:hypothetical protein
MSSSVAHALAVVCAEPLERGQPGESNLSTTEPYRQVRIVATATVDLSWAARCTRVVPVASPLVDTSSLLGTLGWS